MEAQRICRKCDVYLKMSDDIKEYVERYVRRMQEDDKVTDEIYERRLTICYDCNMLCADICRACGCYVGIRAAVKEKACPNEKW